MSAPFNLRASTPVDRDAIAALLDRVLRPLPRAWRERMWDWRYHRNPERSTEVPEFLVAEQGGSVVGALGLIPLRFETGGTAVRALATCDFAVEPSARGCGLALKMRSMSPELAALSFTSSSNQQASKIALALGGSEVAAARTKFLKPLRSAGLIRRRIDERWPGRFNKLSGPLAAAAAVLPDLYLQLGRARRRRKVLAEVVIERVQRFDPNYDSLWERSRQASVTAVTRDSRYLAWRYADYPFPGIEACCARLSGRVTALMITQLAVDQDGLAFMAVLEMLEDNEGGPALDGLIAQSVRRAATAGAHYVAAWCSTAAGRERLARCGFIAREAPFSPYTCKLNPAAAQPAAGMSEWYVSMGDGDASFFPPAG